MKATEFAIICAELGIHPSVALEVDEVRDALKQRRDAATIRRILEESF